MNESRFVCGMLDPQSVTDADLLDIRALLERLSPGCGELSRGWLRVIAATAFLFAVFDREAPREGGFAIVAMATLNPLPTLLRFKAHVDDVVLREDYEGRGLGRFVIETLVRHARAVTAERRLGSAGWEGEMVRAARERRMACLDLTSGTKQERERANALYQKLGFEPRDTNAYRKPLSGR